MEVREREKSRFLAGAAEKIVTLFMRMRKSEEGTLCKEGGLKSFVLTCYLGDAHKISKGKCHIDNWICHLRGGESIGSEIEIKGRSSHRDGV